MWSSSDWLLPLSAMFSRHIRCSLYQWFIPLWCQIIFPFVDLPHYYSVTSWWPFGLFPLWDSYEHSYTDFLWTNVFIFLVDIRRSGSLGRMVTLQIFLSMCPTCQGSYYHPCFMGKGARTLKGKEIAQDHRARESFGWLQPRLVTLCAAGLEPLQPASCLFSQLTKPWSFHLS